MRRRRPPLGGGVRRWPRASPPWTTPGRLVDVLVRLAGPRTPGAPENALPPEEGTAALTKTLGGRTLLGWTADELTPVLERLAALGHPARLGVRRVAGTGPLDLSGRWPGQVRDRVAQWRGELDPATGELRQPWPPGTADRLHLLLTRIANASPARDDGLFPIAFDDA
ncbi:hypothetical protein [Streptomyces sp. URMC 129]|uniref:hypothetical protein n=1 Tax=Streptomyces sp. URMC 129 TaxID=3423407 RepID=UPI003F19DA68